MAHGSPMSLSLQIAVPGFEPRLPDSKDHAINYKTYSPSSPSYYLEEIGRKFNKLEI